MNSADPAGPAGQTGIDCTATQMYTHAYLPQPTAEQLRQYVVAHPFAQLITASQEGGLHCTAVAVVPESTDAEQLTLLGHLARRNSHAEALTFTRSALLLFQGPHAYISPRWYEERPDVPTWNYIAVQIRGELELVDAVIQIEDILRRTIDHVERGEPRPWKIEHAPADLVARLVPRVRGFRMRAQRLEGTFKLSQNKTERERANIIAGLLATGGAEEAAMAALLEAGRRNDPT